MTDLLDRVRRTLQRHRLAAPDTRVIVALSGGSDSVALAHLLARLAESGHLRVTGVAHFNHQLRPAADADERFSADVAKALGWPFLAERADVAASARRTKRSVETAARTLRHAFLERARVHFGADQIALGHTRDDQAETFLLRLLRGAGARGLAAMHPSAGAVIRPLIDCRRADLIAWLAAEGLAFVTDETNADVSVPRNRVRHELLPLLESRFNPSVVDALADASDIAREEWDWMGQAASRLAPALCRRDDAAVQDGEVQGNAVRIDAEALNGLPVALARLIARQAMSELTGGRDVTFAHVDEALRISRGGGPVDLPGLTVQRKGPDVVLTSRPGRGRRIKAESVNLFRVPLSIPGEAGAQGAWSLAAELLPSFRAVPTDVGAGRDDVAVLRADLVRGPLVVRSRRPGDRFRPLGLNGTKKLQDFFVDRKVARSSRDAVPLVVDAQDRILWVAGHAIDEEFRVTDPAQAVLVLRLKLLGGPV